jgi:phosphoribosylanthranilate isomerase
MKLKVCGLRDIENIKQVAALQPDYMGFIFYERSKRFVGNDFIIPSISSEIKKVGVFVNSPIDYGIEKIKRYKLDYVQLHGDESAEYCASMSSHVKVIKAFGIDDNFDFKTVEPYKKYCNYFLFDTKTTDYGGSGMQFNWNVLEKYDNQIPFFLSGGIGLKEIEQLKIKKLNIYAVDVNSKFELEPGIKDIERLKKIKY